MFAHTQAKNSMGLGEEFPCLLQASAQKVRSGKIFPYWARRPGGFLAALLGTNNHMPKKKK